MVYSDRRKRYLIVPAQVESSRPREVPPYYAPDLPRGFVAVKRTFPAGYTKERKNHHAYWIVRRAGDFGEGRARTIVLAVPKLRYCADGEFPADGRVDREAIAEALNRDLKQDYQLSKKGKWYPARTARADRIREEAKASRTAARTRAREQATAMAELEEHRRREGEQEGR